MATNIDIKAVEQRAWNSFFSDGRLELTFGLAFLIMGLMIVAPDDGPLYWISIPLLLIVPGAAGIIIKKFISEPRIGRATFSRKRRLNMAGAVLFLAAAVLFGVATWMMAISISPAVNSWLSTKWVLVLLVGKVAIVFAAIAYFLDYWGVFFIGLGLGACFVEREIWGTPYLFFVIGAGIVFIGAAKLIKFIRKNPVVREEE